MTHRLTSHVSVNSILLIVLIAVIVFIGSTAPGAALTPRYVTIREQTQETGIDFKELSVACPEGMKAISGGTGVYYASGEDEHLRPKLISSFMYPDDAHWYGEAVQPKEADSKWTLEVHVTCVSNQD